jgi:hypothetical protein
MDPLPNSLFAVPCHRSDDSPSSSEDRKRDEHRAETSKASGFRQALHRRNAAGTAATAKNGCTGKTPAGGAKTTGTRARAFDQALSPSLMKLREQGGQVSENLPVTGDEANAELCESSTGGTGGGGTPPTLPNRPQLLGTVNLGLLGEHARLQAQLASGPKKKDEESKSKDGGDSDSSTGSAQPIPTPTGERLPEAREAAAPSRVLPPTPLLMQVVEFASVAQNRDGFMEFNMGLSQNVLGGMRIRVCSYGKRRVGLNVRSSGEGAVGEEEISGLVEALRQRDVEVVDVTFE